MMKSVQCCDFCERPCPFESNEPGALSIEPGWRTNRTGTVDVCPQGAADLGGKSALRVAECAVSGAVKAAAGAAD